MKEDIKPFVDGYHLFRKKYFNRHSTKFTNLVKYGQNPKVLVIACSDSRVDPAILMGCEPGDLFVVRNVANLVPHCELDSGKHGTSAALEFGICGLDIKNIVVLGHTQCGGITSMLDKKSLVLQEDTFIGRWMALAAHAYELTMLNCSQLTREQQIDACGKYALIQSFQNLLSFPWIAEKVKKNELRIYVWNFDLATGIIEAYCEESGEFAPISS